jgi:hypothetical protein
LTPTPSKLDLGVVSPGSRVKATIKVANHSPAQIHIHSFETSCDCLRVQPPSAVVNSGQSIDLIIDLDLSHDPTFTGSLSLSVQGYCNPGSDFSLTVTADVKR